MLRQRPIRDPLSDQVLFAIVDECFQPRSVKHDALHGQTRLEALVYVRSAETARSRDTPSICGQALVSMPAPLPY